jgi:predicted amidohydrolase YtcJ
MSDCSPDLVYIDGNILTLDASGTIASALALKDGKIVAVGDDRQIRGLAGKSTKLVGLGGVTVLPGVNDSHLHTAAYGGSRPPLTLDVGYPAVKSIEDIKRVLQARAAEVKPGEWIRGMGWDEGYLAECLEDPSRRLTRWDLDQASPHNPAYLIAFTQHEIVANSLALKLAGITGDTVSSPGSEVVKLAVTGEPTGMLREMAAHSLLQRVVPPLTPSEKRQAIVEMMRRVNERGITSVTEPAMGPGGANIEGGLLGPECISIYNDLLNEGVLTCRVNILWLLGEAGSLSLKDLAKTMPQLGIHSGFGNEWLKIGGIKLFADGIPNAKTAWMHSDYPDGGNGSLVIPGDSDGERHDELVNQIVLAHRCGFQCGVHAIGGKAVEACIDGFIEAQRHDTRDLRHYVIHGDFISPADIERAARNNIGVSAQPILKWVFSDLMDRAVGQELSGWQSPLRSLLDAGVHVSGSSDAPVTEPDWLQGVEAAVLRRSKASGTVRGPQQRITTLEALRMFTMGSAWQDHLEHLKGSIEPGKLADLCFLDRDILSTPPDEIHTIKNLATVVGGRLVYGGFR